jgi:hypothetical protein
MRPSGLLGSVPSLSAAASTIPARTSAGGIARGVGAP